MYYLSAYIRQYLLATTLLEECYTHGKFRGAVIFAYFIGQYACGPLKATLLKMAFLLIM